VSSGAVGGAVNQRKKLDSMAFKILKGTASVAYESRSAPRPRAAPAAAGAAPASPTRRARAGGGRAAGRGSGRAPRAAPRAPRRAHLGTPPPPRPPACPRWYSDSDAIPLAGIGVVASGCSLTAKKATGEWTLDCNRLKAVLDTITQATWEADISITVRGTGLSATAPMSTAKLIA
jgi:hypothetical protein